MNLDRNDMAEVMYAMDIIASKLDGGRLVKEWEKATGLSGPAEWSRPSVSEVALYKGWLVGKKGVDEEAFRNAVSAFVFLLARKAFGDCEALDNMVCDEEVF